MHVWLLVYSVEVIICPNGWCFEAGQTGNKRASEALAEKSAQPARASADKPMTSDVEAVEVAAPGADTFYISHEQVLSWLQFVESEMKSDVELCFGS